MNTIDADARLLVAPGLVLARTPTSTERVARTENLTTVLDWRRSRTIITMRRFASTALTHADTAHRLARDAETRTRADGLAILSDQRPSA